jgi:uncharacterized protein
MVKGESADAMCQRVTALGGKARPAFDIKDQGRMTACTDPNGARFDVWEPKKFLGTNADSALHGAPSWYETMTTDVGRAAKFYSGLFGWTPEAMPMPGSSYTTFKLGDAKVAGMLGITPRMGGVSPHWVTYFTVNDCEATAQEAVKLGATLYRRVHEAAGVGRFSRITSPQGVEFRVIEYIR